ncbi:MAG TPA: hypothetical protein VJX10_12535 [Pseudonocardiaceae bacterium]|nr:hypothetical protein [Pseudonocardiaceae bacterium]
MRDGIALGQPTVGDEELAAIAEVFAPGGWPGTGSRGFEAEFAAAPGVIAVDDAGLPGGLRVGAGWRRGRRGVPAPWSPGTFRARSARWIR